MPVPLDEFPIHQAPLSLAHVATSDRNFYDRCYFNAHGRSGDLFFISGLGVYPNLGVTDAYALVRRGDEQAAVHFSDTLSDDRLHQRVGDYRIEVIEPLRTLRLVCDDSDLGLSFDLTWEGSFDAVQEQHHTMLAGGRTILDASRFAQVGTWSGVIRVDGDDIEVDPDRWVGTRDRSWGIRPVGEPEPPGRNADEPLEGFWWMYAPLRFEDFAVIVIVQERPDGFRTLNDATRVWVDGRIEQLGWPRYEIAYAPGTRHPERARLHLTDSGGAPLVIDIETLMNIPLHVGGGYGGDPDWTHGQWRGRGFRQRLTYDLSEQALASRVPLGVIDHVARAECGELEGWGMFEHASFGRHDPTGFAGWD